MNDEVIWFTVIPGNAERGTPQAVSTVVKEKFCFLKVYTNYFKIRCIWVENIQVFVIIFSVLFKMLHNKNIFEKNLKQNITRCLIFFKEIYHFWKETFQQLLETGPFLSHEFFITTFDQWKYLLMTLDDTGFHE